MRFVSLPCAVSCLAVASATLGCSVPDVAFFADDGGPQDGRTADGTTKGDAGTDGASDGASDGPTGDAPCSSPTDIPPYANACCGPKPCSGVQCTDQMLCTMCNQQCAQYELCCVKMNKVTCWNLDAGACP